MVALHLVQFGWNDYTLTQSPAAFCEIKASPISPQCHVISLAGHMTVQPCLVGATAISYAHHLRIVHNRDGKFGALLFVDFGLLNLDVGLAQLAGCDDHFSTMISSL